MVTGRYYKPKASDHQAALTATQVLVTMFNVKVDLVSDFRALCCLCRHGAEECCGRNKHEDEREPGKHNESWEGEIK
jgi:hypothetical protein